jgi:mRNA interferase HicA
VKRADLTKEIEGLGCMLVLNGAKHDWYHNPAKGVSQPVPRHREITERLARHIIGMLQGGKA